MLVAVSRCLLAPACCQRLGLAEGRPVIARPGLRQVIAERGEDHVIHGLSVHPGGGRRVVIARPGIFENV